MQTAWHPPSERSSRSVANRWIIGEYLFMSMCSTHARTYQRLCAKLVVAAGHERNSVVSGFLFGVSGELHLGSFCGPCVFLQVAEASLSPLATSLYHHLQSPSITTCKLPLSPPANSRLSPPPNSHLPPPATSAPPWQKFLLCVLWTVGVGWGPQFFPWQKFLLFVLLDGREGLGRDAPWPHVLVVHPGNACSLC